MKIVEAFSGIGSQAKALEKIKNENSNFEYEILNTIEWDVNAIYSYDIIHNGPQQLPKKTNKMNKDSLLDELSEFELSLDGKTPATRRNFARMSKEVLRAILFAIERTKNLVSIKKVKAEQLPDGIDILTYSFPCQDLSLSGYFHGDSGGIDRSANNSSSMLWEVERILQEFDEIKGKSKPKMLIMENVSSIKSKKHIGHFEEWIQSLENMGYVSEHYDLNAIDFGIPQTRKRTFMISVYYGNDLVLRSNIIRRLEESVLNNPSQIQGITHTKVEEILKIDYSKEQYYNEAIEQIPNNTKSRKKIGKQNPMIYKDNKVSIDRFRTLTTKQDRHPNSGLIEIDKEVFSLGNTKKASFRYLTPRESFLLMGFDEQDFENLISNNLYTTPSQQFLTKAKLTKLAGNSIVVNVIKEVFKETVVIKEMIDSYHNENQMRFINELLTQEQMPGIYTTDLYSNIQMFFDKDMK